MIAEASFLSSSILINSSTRQLELIAKASFSSCFIVKQNCCWKIVVRRMQGVRSIASINLYAEEKELFLFAYDAPMTFQIHFCLTIKYPRRVVMPLANHFSLFASLPVRLSFACRHLACLVFLLNTPRLQKQDKQNAAPYTRAAQVQTGD